MAQARVKVDPEMPGYYHVFTKVVQNLFLLIDQEKENFIKLMNFLAKTFFVEILSFEVMDNHFHIVLKIQVPDCITLEELESRFKNLYPDREFNPKRAAYYIKQWGDLSIFMKTLKERFATYYNRKHGTCGHFWGSRFKSIVLADEEAVLSCMAYVEVNAVRANKVKDPRFYRYGSLGHVLAGNEDHLVALPAIRHLLHGFTSGEMEEKIREKLGEKLSYLPQGEQEAYVTYVAFVQMRVDSFAQEIKIFCKGVILGSRQNIENIYGCLNHRKKWRHHGTVNLSSVY